ncbi:MAG: molybdopterin converting factor subunit 1 [Thiobacillaceae bacterium]
MKLRVLYFARLREALGIAEESLVLPAAIDTAGALVDWLRARGGAWAAELAEGRAWRLAVNQDLAGPQTRLQDGDEVALFPPVTGG